MHLEDEKTKIEREGESAQGTENDSLCTCLFLHALKQTNKTKQDSSRFYFHLFVLFFTFAISANAFRSTKKSTDSKVALGSLFAQPFNSIPFHFKLQHKHQASASPLSLLFLSLSLSLGLFSFSFQCRKYSVVHLILNSTVA